MSGVIIAYGIKEGGITVTPFRVLGYVFWVAVMTVLYYLVEVLIRSLAFFVLSNGTAMIPGGGRAYLMHAAARNCLLWHLQSDFLHNSALWDHGNLAGTVSGRRADGSGCCMESIGCGGFYRTDGLCMEAGDTAL